MPMYNYVIRGRICAPEGSKLNEHETAIILPSGVSLKLWEKAEIGDGEDYRELDYDQLNELDVFFDGDACRFDGPVVDGDRIWPPRCEDPIIEVKLETPVGYELLPDTTDEPAIDWDEPLEWDTGEAIHFALFNDGRPHHVSACREWQDITGDTYVAVDDEGEILGCEDEGYPTVRNVKGDA